MTILQTIVLIVFIGFFLLIFYAMGTGNSRRSRGGPRIEKRPATGKPSDTKLANQHPPADTDTTPSRKADDRSDG